MSAQRACGLWRRWCERRGVDEPELWEQFASAMDALCVELAGPAEPPELICIGCQRAPGEILEYIDAAREAGMSPTDYVWAEEGTLNRENGHFLCTSCYMLAGMPTRPGGWRAP